MRLPALPSAPRAFPPSLEQRIALRANVRVFWMYALLVCGISFLVAGTYAGNLTTLYTGGILLLGGLLFLVIRFAVGSTLSRLLRFGDWVVGHITRMESMSKIRRIHYVFTFNGTDRSGSILEEKPWSDDFIKDALVAVLFDPTEPGRSVLLSGSAVEAMCELWGMEK